MSGSLKVDGIAEEVDTHARTPLHKAFAEHLRKVAVALLKLERVLVCGWEEGSEVEAISGVLGQFSAGDMADQGAKQFREGVTCGADKALANVRTHLPTRVETARLGYYSPEECAAYDAGYNDALTRAHKLLSRRPGSLVVADADALDRLARQIAENTVRSDIESYAEWVEVDGQKFMDTTRAQDGSGDPVKALEYVRFAVEYIDQRGDAFDWHMQRHISAPHLVRFVDKAEVTA